MRSVFKSFAESVEPIEVLKGIDLEVQSGETLAIMGKSGSGKTTLLSLLAGLDRPDSGEIFVEEMLINEMTERQLTKFRGQNIGIVFQQFHLMPHLTALENVSLPLEIGKQKDVEAKALRALDQVGMLYRKNHFPSQLSGGESQRVAIARAIVTKPKILLADEPTGNLDEETGEQIENLMFGLIKESRITLVMVTHDLDLAKKCESKLDLFNGVLV